MPRRKTLPKRVLAERMRAQHEMEKRREVMASCRCLHPSIYPCPRPGYCYVGWVFCLNCRHNVQFEDGRPVCCVSEPRLGTAGFTPDRTQYQPLP